MADAAQQHQQTGQQADTAVPIETDSQGSAQQPAQSRSPQPVSPQDLEHQQMLSELRGYLDAIKQDNWKWEAPRYLPR